MSHLLHFPFSPGRYLREGWKNLLEHIPPQHPWQVLRQEDLWESQGSQQTRAILAGLGQTQFPMQENAQALATFEAAARKLEDTPSLPLPPQAQEVLRDMGFVPYEDLWVRPFFVKRATVSVGLKTRSVMRKSLKCMVELTIREERWYLRTGTTDRAECRHPRDCALTGRGLRVFEVFCLPATPSALKKALRHALLDPAAPAKEYALTQKPRLCALAVFACAGLGWSALGTLFWHLLRWLGGLWGLSLPPDGGFVALAILGWALLRWVNYAGSIKR